MGGPGGSEQSPPSRTGKPTNPADPSQPVATASSDELTLALDRCEFPVIVWTPADGTMNLANEASAELFNVPLERIVGRPVFDYFEPREAIERSAGVLTSGAADNLSGTRLVRRNELGRVSVQFWTRVIELDGQPRIVALFVPIGDLAKLGRDPARPWLDLMPFTVGLADEQWRIVEVSTDISNIMGLTPDDVVGTNLLDLFSPDHRSTIRDGEEVPRAIDLRHLRLANREGGDDEVSLMIAPSGRQPNAIIFAIVGRARSEVEAMSDRILELEMRLRRIAAEVRAAGVLEALPSIEDHPKLAELTTRQWEVVSMLIQGQRVATIASNLFVSQSTVRNHLASIFQKFDVHSQAELLALLTPRPSTDRG